MWNRVVFCLFVLFPLFTIHSYIYNMKECIVCAQPLFLVARCLSWKNVEGGEVWFVWNSADNSAYFWVESLEVSLKCRFAASFIFLILARPWRRKYKISWNFHLLRNGYPSRWMDPYWVDVWLGGWFFRMDGWITIQLHEPGNMRLQSKYVVNAMLCRLIGTLFRLVGYYLCGRHVFNHHIGHWASVSGIRWRKNPCVGLTTQWEQPASCVSPTIS